MMFEVFVYQLWLRKFLQRLAERWKSERLFLLLDDDDDDENNDDIEDFHSDLGRFL